MKKLVFFLVITIIPSKLQHLFKCWQPLLLYLKNFNILTLTWRGSESTKVCCKLSLNYTYVLINLNFKNKNKLIKKNKKNRIWFLCWTWLRRGYTKVNIKIQMHLYEIRKQGITDSHEKLISWAYDKKLPQIRMINNHVWHKVEAIVGRHFCAWWSALNLIVMWKKKLKM